MPTAVSVEDPLNDPETIFVQLYKETLCSPRRALARVEAMCQTAKGQGTSSWSAYCSLARGWILLYLGRSEDASRHIDMAQDIFHQEGNELGVARCNHARGALQRFLGNNDDAQVSLDRAERAFNRLSAAADAARCARDQAALFGWIGETDRARAYLDKAQSFWQDCDPPHEYLLNRCVEGVLLTGESKYSEALAILEETGVALSRLNCPMGEAICRYEEAWALHSQDLYQQALEVFQQVQEIFEQERLPHRVALCDKNIGIVLRFLGKYESAIDRMKCAVDVFQRMGMKQDEAASRLNMGNVLLLQNRYQESLSQYQEAWKGYESAGRVSGMARCLMNQGLIHHTWGEYARALTLFDEAANLFEQLQEAYALGVCWENMADTQSRVGQGDLAIEHYQRAEVVYDRCNVPVGVARCAQGKARVLAQQGRLDDSLTELHRAIRTFEEKDLALREAAARVIEGEILTQMERFDDARVAYLIARTLFEPQGMLVDIARCDLGLGEVHLALKERGQGEHRFRQALSVFGETFPELSWQAHDGLARSLQGAAQHREALAHYRQSVEMIRRARAWVPGEVWSARFFALREETYRRAFDLAVALGDAKAALQVTEAARAQAFLSLLEEGEPEVYWQDGSIEKDLLRLRREMEALRQKVRTLSTGGIRVRAGKINPELVEKLSRLEEGMARYDRACQQAWTAQRTRALRGWSPPFDLSTFRRTASMVCPDGWQALVYDVDQSLTIIHLDAETEQMWQRPLKATDRDRLNVHTSPEEGDRHFLYQSPSPKGHLRPGVEQDLRRLYELLIPREVSQKLQSDRPLFLVPHRMLHTLPFAALLGPADYLVQQSELVVLPSLQALSFLSKSMPEDPTAASNFQQILLLGASEFDGRWVNLPGVPDELDQIGRVWQGHPHVRTIQEATSAVFMNLVRQNELSQYDLVHICTHAGVDQGRAWTARIGLRDQDLLLRDLLEAQLGARLVILSACRAGTGRRYEGEEVIGLAWAFFAIGARALISSLWNVQDRSATELMERLHTILREGGRPAAALCQAQRAMIARGYTPYHWAGFMLRGIP